jgi:protein involved in polysaccharide export with SLBB domain
LGAQDSLHTLIQLAGGTLPSAIRDKALLVRFVAAGQRESLWVDLDRVAGGEQDPPLRDGDHLFVQFRSGYHVLPTVEIQGEVEHPGTYPIVLGQDRFSNLVRWAGGFRPQANRSAIHLVREIGSPNESDKLTPAQKDLEFDRLARLPRSGMTESEYTKFQTKLAEQKNAFLIDWASIQKGSSDVDPLLQEGDVVRVDRLVQTVRVEGEVRRPGFVDYVPGRSLREYIDLSGGFTDRASKSTIRVSRSLTGQVIPARSVKSIQPGDFVWVPERKDVDTWAVVRDVVAVASQVAVLVFTLSR